MMTSDETSAQEELEEEKKTSCGCKRKSQTCKRKSEEGEAQEPSPFDLAQAAVDSEEANNKQNVDEWQKLQNEAAEFKDKYWRLLADSENTRKRLQKEKEDLSKYAVENVVCELLQPLDTLEQALGCIEQASDEIKNWAVGFKMILDQFKGILGNHDIYPFSAVGQHFDPHHHEAMEAVETEEYPDGVVIEEILKGYKMGEKTIRAAKVRVAKAPSKNKPAGNENANDAEKEELEAKAPGDESQKLPKE